MYNTIMNKNIKGRIGNLGNKETMSKNLKRYLNSRGLNPHQFAKIMDFKYTTVMNWLSANSYPRIDKIELMARYFGIDKSDLVEEYNNEEIKINFSDLDVGKQEQLLKLSKLDLDNTIVDTAEIMSKANETFRDKVFSYADYEYFKYLKEIEQKNSDSQNSAS